MRPNAVERLSIRKPLNRGAGRKSDGPAGSGAGLNAQRRQVRSILKQPGFAVADPPARLPAGTPAWTEGGRIHLTPQALFLPRPMRQRILRHEAVHSAQQRLGMRRHGDSGDIGEQQEAEQQARRLERPGAEPEVLVPADAKALLAFPPQTYPPWDRVWVGHPGIVGEVVEEGVAVRIYLTYDALGIAPGMRQERTFVCGD